MYDRDMPRMAKHALASPQGLVDVIGFVLCTIQQPFQRTHIQMADVRQHGAASQYLFGSKRVGYQYALDHADVLHAAIAKAVDVRDTVGAIDVLTNVPGLGIVKAAFVAQICGLDVACLDTHNLRALGMAEAALKLAKSVKQETKRKKIADYVALCARTGGSRHWWNRWCETVAGSRFNKSLPTADAVSAYHWECINA
jgi:hypothetical protein